MYNTWLVRKIDKGSYTSKKIWLYMKRGPNTILYLVNVLLDIVSFICPIFF